MRKLRWQHLVGECPGALATKLRQTAAVQLHADAPTNKPSYMSARQGCPPRPRTCPIEHTVMLAAFAGTPSATKHGHGGGGANHPPSPSRMCSRADAKCRRYWSQRTSRNLLAGETKPSSHCYPDVVGEHPFACLSCALQSCSAYEDSQMMHAECPAATTGFSHLSLPQQSGSWLAVGNAAAAHASAAIPHDSVLRGTT